jgi:hypothetical protein
LGSSGGFTGADLNTIRVTEVGQRPHPLMGLDRIPESELDGIISALRGERG